MSLGGNVIDAYTEKFGEPLCGQCGKVVKKEHGYHIALVAGTGEKDVPFTHWDCDKAYSAKIDAMLEDAHSETGNGLIELGTEVAEKRKHKDFTHYHIEDSKIAPVERRQE